MRVLITGASGQLGPYLLRAAGERGPQWQLAAWSGRSTGQVEGVALRPVDLLDGRAIEQALNDFDPQAIVHAGAVSSLKESLENPDLAEAVNVQATSILAGWAWYRSARVVLCSSDMVFDGRRGNYVETDEANPVSVYGRTKLAAERVVCQLPGGVAVRLSLMYGPGLHGKKTFYDQLLEALRSGKPLNLFNDEWRTPLSIADGARGLIAACDSKAAGLYHLGGPERITRYELGRRVAAKLGLNDRGIKTETRMSVKGPEERPRDLSLNCAKWDLDFPDFERKRIEEAIGEFR